MQTTEKRLRMKFYPSLKRVSVPPGTPVIPATNLPRGGWWVEPWEGMTEDERMIREGQGIWISEEERVEGIY